MKKNALISSILTIALCVSLIAGSTFALFTSDDAINVAVNSAKVKVVAEVGEFKTYSMDVLQPAGKFETTGTAEYDEATGKFTLTNIAPGDKVEFPINITNDSNITIQYRVKWTVEGDLVDALVATVDGVALTSSTSDWALWTTDEAKTKTLNVSVELPVGTLNDYQEKTANVAFVVEAVQGNAIVDQVTTADQLAATLMMGRTATLGDDVELDAASAISIPAGSVATIDLGGYTLTGNNAKDEGAVIVNNGTLNIVGTTGTLTNSVVNGGAVVENNGTMTISGANIVGAPIGESGYPAYAVTTSGDLTIEAGTTITSDRGVIAMSNGANVTINGGNFTVSGAANGRTHTFHTVYAYGYSSTLTINDGYFEQAFDSAAGSSVICPAGATININGGDFRYTGVAGSQSGVFQLYFGYGAPIRVNGGTFNDATVTNSQITIGEYYEAVLDTATGISTVQAKAGVNFVKDDAELAAIIDDINTDSAYWNTPITVVMAAGEYTGEYTVKQYPGYNGSYLGVNSSTDYIDLTLVAQEGAVFTGHVTVVGNGGGGGYATNHIGTTFKNITFDATDSYVNAGFRRNVYLHSGTDNVIFDNCTFKNAEYINVGDSGQGSVFNTSFVDCTFDNGGLISGYWPGSSQSTLTLDNCKGDMGDKGIVNGQKAGYVYVKDSNLVAGEYGFRTNASLNITVEDSTIAIRDNAPLVFFRGAGSSATFTNCNLTYATPVAYKNATPDNTSLVIDGETVVVKSASAQTDFDDAVASGDIVTVNLGEGSYNLPGAASKDITIVGTEDTVINVTTPDLSGSNVAFEGVTIKTNNNNYQGVQHVETVTYTDVTFDGGMNLYGKKVVFNHCTFNLTGQYIWTYAGENVEFNDCTFNTEGKAILVYNEGNNSSVVTIKDCTFNASKAAYTWDNQYVSAVEVDASEADEEGRTFTVNFEGTNTVNFTGTAADGNGNSGFNGLYRVKDASVSLTDHYTINVDGNKVLPNP